MSDTVEITIPVDAEAAQDRSLMTIRDGDESEKRRSSKRAPTLVNGKVTQKRSARLKVSLRPGVPLRTRAEPR
jgi:hypothetical protein